MKRPLPGLVVLLILVSLGASPALAAGGRGLPALEKPGFFATTWRLLGALVPAIRKSHGAMDPDGNQLPPLLPAPPATGPDVANTDSHGAMDPDGTT